MLAWALRDSHNAWQSYSRVSYGKCTWLHCSRQLFLGNMSCPCSWQQTNSFATKLSCSFVCQWATYPESHLRPLDLQWFFCSHGVSHFQGFGNKERGKFCKILDIHGISNNFYRCMHIFPKSCRRPPPAGMLKQSFVCPTISPGKFSTNYILPYFPCKRWGEG